MSASEHATGRTSWHPSRSRRVVVGACGADEQARLVARALLMSGREVVFIGGDQSIEQVAHTVVSEDASSVVLDGSAEDLARLVEALRRAGVGHVETSGVDLAGPAAAV